MSDLYSAMHLPCGATAYFDHGSGCSHRCDTCGATLGSISQPQHCKDEDAKYEAWEKIDGAGWDYDK